MQFKVASIIAVISAVSALPSEGLYNVTNIKVSDDIKVISAAGKYNGTLDGGKVAGAIDTVAKVDYYGVEYKIVGGANGRAQYFENGTAIAEGALQAVVTGDGCDIVIQASGEAKAQLNPLNVDMRGSLSVPGTCNAFNGQQVSGKFFVDKNGKLQFESNKDICYSYNGPVTGTSTTTVRTSLFHSCFQVC